MAGESATAFFSYRRSDSEFALRLAGDLKASGADVWIDQLDIEPGQEWDNAIEIALSGASRMILILTPESVESRKVRNEIAYALDEDKLIIPILYKDCTVPLQLRRVQYIDFRNDYARGLQTLLKVLPLTQSGRSHKAAAGVKASSLFTPPKADQFPLDELPSPKVPNSTAPSWADVQRVKGLLNIPVLTGHVFPVYGVTIGQTTIRQLENLGHSRTSTIDKKTGEPYECYEANEVDLWYDKQGVVDHMYLTYSVTMPPEWRKLGFDWAQSYDSWLAVLKKRGYSVKITKAPHQTKFDGKPSFGAEVIATRQEPVAHELVLDFNYGKGTTADARNTLYSISVRRP